MVTVQKAAFAYQAVSIKLKGSIFGTKPTPLDLTVFLEGDRMAVDFTHTQTDFLLINIPTDTQLYVPELFIILSQILIQLLAKFIAGNISYTTVLKIKY